VPACSSLIEVLRLSARVEFCPDDYGRLARAATRLQNWQELPEAADAHGLAPLVYEHMTRVGIEMPAETRRELVSLVLLHRHANRVRFRVLGEILDAFFAAGIDVIVLKGAALAHLLYPSVALRQLSDIDLLVGRPHAARAQSLLARLGFMAPPVPLSRHLAGHHHLPGAIRTCDGQIVQVEIHHNALSRDAPGSLTIERLTSRPQRFSVEGRAAYALGHADMLYHLCRHVAECAPLLRLIWVADVVGYATRYRHQIPWAEVRRRYPFVLNALSLLHLVTALPGELLEHVVPACAGVDNGVGVAGKPLTEIFRKGRPLGDVGRDIFHPSDWWLRLYYGVGSDRSLWWHRWVRHPLHLANWLARRSGSYVQWRLHAHAE